MRAAPPREWKPLEEAVPRDVFRTEVKAWAKRIGVHPKVVQVRAMKRKWGSCSTAGRVSFDTDLLRQHAEFRKRVIVEELLHLRIPNHGKLFKTMLAAYLNLGKGGSHISLGSSRRDSGGGVRRREAREWKR